MYKKIIAVCGLVTLLVISGSFVVRADRRMSGGTNMTPGVLQKAQGAGGSDDAVGIVTVTQGGVLSQDCLGYTTIMPGNSKLDANSVTDATSMSPTLLSGNWNVADHVSVKDSSYSGERHIVKRESGVQWFGYDKDPNNDIMLMRHEGPVYSINIKQAPVRADWHTINGSGMVFGASFDGTEGASELGYTSDRTFSGYAFVATQADIEIRYYPSTPLSAFSDGSAPYEVITSTPKKCNSQSLTINFTEEGPIFMVGLTKLEFNVDYSPDGDYIGAMVDYAEHACPSLSTVFMFNFTVNGENYFS